MRDEAYRIDCYPSGLGPHSKFIGQSGTGFTLKEIIVKQNK